MSGLEVHKQIFRSTCKLISKIVQQAKCTFFNTKILACTSSKQLFKITNTLPGKSKTSSLPSSIPSALLPQRFCDFFVNSLYNPWQSQLPDHVSTSHHSHSFWWFPTDCLPPCVRINSTQCWTRPPSARANWTLYHHRYWLNSLKTFSHLLLQLLMTLFWQAAFLLCSNPPLSGHCWKKALNTENLKNYSPVSNLPFLSKITEKIVLLQLSQHLESNSLLYPLQSAIA